MLRKTLAASVVLALCLCAVAVAGGDPAGKIQGTITKVDMDQKTLVVKDSNGQEKTFYWDSATKVSGDLKEGASVTLSATDQQGKMVASSIQVGGAPAPKKPY
jgi:Domain of unknown function (DUF5666)